MGNVQCVPILVGIRVGAGNSVKSEDGRCRPHVVACDGGVDSLGFLGQGGMSVCDDCYLSEGDDVLWLL